MALTPEQEQKAQAWIEGRAMACLRCGNQHLSIGTPFHFVAVEAGMARTLLEVEPVLPLFCHECGHVELLSAVVIGVVPPALRVVRPDEPP